MKSSQVPQQNISTYARNKKAMYAIGSNGKYIRIASSGWEVEEAATRQALEELARLAALARQQVEAGKASPLYFHMYDKRMDLQTLAQATGFFKWQIQRHCKPKVFASLAPKLLARYAEALGMSSDALRTLPKEDANGS